MNATPTLTVTIDNTHTVTVTLPDKDSARVLANRLMVGTRSMEGLSTVDRDACSALLDAVTADIANDV